jgi:hypothetical protein
VKLAQLSDEDDSLIVVNPDAVCFFRRSAPDRVEIHFAGETTATVRGTVEFVRITLEGGKDLPVGRPKASIHAENSPARQN